MSNRTIVVLLLVGIVCFSANLGICSKPPKCIKKMYIERSSDPFDNFYSGYFNRDGVLKAGKINKKIRPEIFGKFKWNGIWLAGAASKNGPVVVNGDIFSNLKLTTATTKNSDRITIGNVNIKWLKKISPWDVVKFILETQIVETSWHLGADLCVVKEDRVGDGTIYRFEGSHRYCTNECVSEDLKFDIGINTRTGEVYLQGKW